MTDKNMRTDATQPDAGDLQIPASDWKSFLDSFSTQHENWLTNILVRLDGKQLVEAKDCRLEGVTPDRKDRNDRIHVLVVCANGDHLDHMVEKAANMIFRRDDHGAHVGLDIVSTDGSVTTLRFRAPARPETLDGVVTTSRYANA